MPWHGLAIAANGSIKPCCQWTGSLGKVDETDIVEQFKNNNKIIELRKQFLDNRKPTSCSSCWTREDQIGESRRLWFKDKFIDSIPSDYTYDAQLDDIYWTQADINLSNVCNLKCRMCGSWASNSWFEEDLILSKVNPDFKKESNPANQKIRQHELENLRSLLPYLSKIKRIDFKGGEPMMAKNHVEFLEMLIEHNLHEKLVLQYTTNGTIVNPKILKTLSMFKKIRIMFSIEGTGDLYSYIRGGKYTVNQMEETLALYNELPNVEIGFNVTVQAYNLLNLRELHGVLKHWDEKYDNVSSNNAFTTICNSPMYLSPFVLPEELRTAAHQQLNGIQDFNVLLKNISNNNIHETHWKTFKHFTKELDKLRGEDVLNMIPELGRYWNE